MPNHPKSLAGLVSLLALAVGPATARHRSPP